MNLATQGAEMASLLQDKWDFDARNDYAVAQIYLSKPAQAIERLTQLEKEKPGEYFVAANLGTAYELAGRNHDALYWIQECIRRNADSHAGTEWLHVKILEAKIQQEADRDYFQHHSVLNLNYREIDSEDSLVLVGNDKRRVKDIVQALEYQLRERLQFVKQPDPAVASLLVDYAAIEAGTRTLESARELLDLALQFGYPANKIGGMIAEYNRTIRLALIRQYSIYCSIASVVVAFLIYAWRRRWITFKREGTLTLVRG